MGIRPQIFTVFGIDNYAGDLSIDLEKRAFLSKEQILASNDLSLSFVKDAAFNCTTKEWHWYYDLVYIGRHSRELEGIVGWIKSGHDDYDSDTFRALSLLYPEFQRSGKKDIPLVTDEWEKKHRQQARPAHPCGGVEFQESWFYPQGFYWMTPVWAFVTKWLLDSLEIKTDPTQYKWMLVWEWS